MMQWIVSSGVLIAIVLLVRAVFQKGVSRRLMYAAWLIVAVRLLVPVSVSLPQQANAPALVNTSAAEHYVASQTIELPTFSVANSAEPQAAQPASTLPLSTVLKAVWLGGSIVVGAWFVWVNLRFGASLKRQRKPLQVADCPLPVYLVETLHTPCLFGVVRPAVYITPQVLQDNARLTHVLTHETCHYRQGDHVFSLVRGVCLAVHWFNPLVWVAAVCSRNDCELACDERTLAQLGAEQTLPYGHTLVDLAAVRPSPSVLLSSATSMASGAGQMKKRIRQIANGRKPILVVVVLVFCLLLVATGCSFLAAGQASASLPQAETQALLQTLTDSVVFNADTQRMEFTLPQEYENSADWNILIYGSVPQGESSMSWHALEQTNQEKSWKAGEIYSFDVAEIAFSELLLTASLRSQPDMERTVDLMERFPEPAANDPLIAQPDGAEPFDFGITLPEGWTVRSVAQDEPVDQVGNFLSSLIMEKDGARMGYIGLASFEPYPTEEVPKEDYYKTVYSDYRLSSMFYLDEYSAIASTETSETALGSLHYIDPAIIEDYQGQLSSAPRTIAPCILHYDTAYKAYVGIQFAANVEVSAEEMQAIAASVVLK